MSCWVKMGNEEANICKHWQIFIKKAEVFDYLKKKVCLAQAKKEEALVITLYN